MGITNKPSQESRTFFFTLHCLRQQDTHYRWKGETYHEHPRTWYKLTPLEIGKQTFCLYCCIRPTRSPRSLLVTEVVSDLHPEDSAFLINSQAPNVSSYNRTGPSSPPPPTSSGAARRVGYRFSNECTQRDRWRRVAEKWPEGPKGPKSTLILQFLRFKGFRHGSS